MLKIVGLIKPGLSCLDSLMKNSFIRIISVLMLSAFPLAAAAGDVIAPGVGTIAQILPSNDNVKKFKIVPDAPPLIFSKPWEEEHKFKGHGIITVTSNTYLEKIKNGVRVTASAEELIAGAKVAIIGCCDNAEPNHFEFTPRTIVILKEAQSARKVIMIQAEECK